MCSMACFLKACKNSSGAPSCRFTLGGAFPGGAVAMNARRAVRSNVFQTGSSRPEAPPGEGGEGARASTPPPLQVLALSGGGSDRGSPSSKNAHPSADATDAHPLADPAEAPEAPAMLAGREGSVRLRACSFEVAADSHYMYILKYRGCRLEMGAGRAGSNCLQLGNACCRPSRGCRGSRHAGTQRGL